MRVMDTDVIIVGAGPTGLMLATELRLAGVRPLVLERRLQHSSVPKASGLGGQILDLLHYRGALEPIFEASGGYHPAARFPFGGVHLDFTQLVDPPMRAMPLPQARLEELLTDRLTTLGGEVHRGHEVIAVEQDERTVTAQVQGPDGPYRVTARFLVGCDGGRSRIRDMAGISFEGTTYPEVNRFATVELPDAVTVLDNGDLDIPGFGRLASGFTRTERGLFAFGAAIPGEPLSVFTTEDELTEYDNDDPLTLPELRASIHRVLGVDLAVANPTRLSRFTFQARQADRYRAGRILLAGDAAHQFPATGIALNAGMLDTVNLAWKLGAAVHGWAPDALLDTYHAERHFAGERTMLHAQAQVALRRGTDPAADALRAVFQELVTDEPALRRMGSMIAGTNFRYSLPNPNGHTLTGAFAPDLPLHTDDGVTTVAALMPPARPVLLDLADRADLRELAADWSDRVDIVQAKTEDRPADLILIRPDAHIAYAATIDEPTDTAAPALREALTRWFGAPA
ncbi:FAD-dependent monooxygenase [Nocardia huaxiensis]|nr:FAD-dependent monooxygenase [Nocardia huaxiensis]